MSSNKSIVEHVGNELPLLPLETIVQFGRILLRARLDIKRIGISAANYLPIGAIVGSAIIVDFSITAIRWLGLPDDQEERLVQWLRFLYQSF